MSTVVAIMSVSLDGYVADLNDGCGKQAAARDAGLARQGVGRTEQLVRAAAR